MYDGLLSNALTETVGRSFLAARGAVHRSDASKADACRAPQTLMVSKSEALQPSRRPRQRNEVGDARVEDDGGDARRKAHERPVRCQSSRGFGGDSLFIVRQFWPCTGAVDVKFGDEDS